jgi:predicted NUDIX family NTP pyrophosphohydrolase
MFRRREGALEVFLVHPGGPFWAKKDLGAWSIPKGEYDEGLDARETAIREFGEETGFETGGALIELGTIQQAGGKTVMAWAFEGDCDPARLRSNTFSMEWPPRSGQTRTIPEVDRGEWFSLEIAETKLIKAQVEFLRRLVVNLRQEPK